MGNITSYSNRSKPPFDGVCEFSSNEAPPNYKGPIGPSASYNNYSTGRWQRVRRVYIWT